MSGFGINHSLYAAREKWREAERARHEEARKVAEAEAPGRAKEIEGRILAEVDASPNKIVVIVARGHADNAPGSVHASDVPFPPLPADKRWDHAAIAYKNKDGELVFMEKRPTPGDGIGPLGSKNNSGTIQELAKYATIDVVGIDLTRYGPGAGDRFLKGATAAVNDNYSFISVVGDTCSSAVLAGFQAARAGSPSAWLNVLETLAKGLHWFTMAFNTYTPTEARLLALEHRAGPDHALRAAYELFPSDHDRGLLAFSSDASGTSSDDGRASLQASTDDEEGASPSAQAATASDPEDARTDGAARQPETDDDEKASQAQVALASDPEDVRADRAARQLETDDDDEDASQEEVALAPDTEVARTGDAAQQPKTDDDEEASQAPGALVSDNEDAAADGAGVMETAKAEEAGDNSTGDDEAAGAPGQPATSASGVEEGFSFSMFAKQGIPVEAAKEAMPVEQPSPEASSGSAMPGSDSAHADIGSEDVGNAAPTKEPVVHHGDLAP